MCEEKIFDGQVRARVWAMIQDIRNSWDDLARLKTLLSAWEQEFGSRFYTLAEELIAERTRWVWSQIAAQEDASSVDDLVRILWRSWSGGEFNVERTSDGIQIHCTKCPIAMAYRTLGKEEYGLVFHCSEDPHIVHGFNSQIKFRRSKTLMNGDDCCDHHYSLVG